MSQEKISCLFSFGPHPHEKISCLFSQEKISCPKRKSHFFSFLGPPNEKIYCLLSPEKISFIKRKSHVLSVLGPPARKSPVSCLMRKYYVQRENIMSYQVWAPPNEKISCLLSHEKISCVKRKSHVFSVLAPPQ